VNDRDNGTYTTVEVKALTFSEWQRNYEVDPGAGKLLFSLTKEVVCASRNLFNKKQLVEALDDIGLPLEQSIEGQEIANIAMYHAGMYAWLCYAIGIAKPCNEAKLEEYLRQWMNCCDRPEAQEALFGIIHILAQTLHSPLNNERSNWDIRQYAACVRTPAGEWAKDYNIGMARGLLVLIEELIVLCQLDLTIMNLTGLEKSVLACIAEQPRITPTEILKKLAKDNRQQMSNILRSLKARHLVDSYEAGRHNWYNLTPEGYQIISCIHKDEETATTEAAISDFAYGKIHITQDREAFALPLKA